MNRKLITTISLIVPAFLAGCAADLGGEGAGDENINEVEAALCSSTPPDALVHFNNSAAAGTAFTATSPLPTDQFTTCTDRFVVNVDNIAFGGAYAVVAGYAGPTPTTQIACTAATVTADARGKLGLDFNYVLSTDQTASGVWSTVGTPHCIPPSITLYTTASSGVTTVGVRVKSYDLYHGVETATPGFAGVIAQ